MRVAEAIELDERTERELRVLAKGRSVEVWLQQRARVILLAAYRPHAQTGGVRQQWAVNLS